MMRLVAQVAAYAAFAAVLGVFSVWPAYHLLGDEQAVVSLTFSHAGQRLMECRRLSAEELAALPPNMRKPDQCPRERHDIEVEMRVDDALLHAQILSPSGLWKDGKATVYSRTAINSGEHEIFVGMSDSGAGKDFDYVLRRKLLIQPGQNVVVSFDDLHGTFVIE